CGLFTPLQFLYAAVTEGCKGEPHSEYREMIAHGVMSFLPSSLSLSWYLLFVFVQHKWVLGVRIWTTATTTK
ncbi:hypothetical protein QHH03_32045, partial [Aphanizomenon sp. 202]|nr:hypothetical protein [Aphanizomenon sp. 202]